MKSSNPNSHILYSLTYDNSLAIVNNLYIDLIKRNNNISLKTISVTRNYLGQTEFNAISKETLVNYYSELLFLKDELKITEKTQKESQENLKGLRRILAYTIHSFEY